VEDLEGGIVSGCAEGSYVNSTVAMLCHLRAPSLLMRARARPDRPRMSLALQSEAAAGFQSRRRR
jgi:hypothetical protein